MKKFSILLIFILVSIVTFAQQQNINANNVNINGALTLQTLAIGGSTTSLVVWDAPSRTFKQIPQSTFIIGSGAVNKVAVFGPNNTVVGSFLTFDGSNFYGGSTTAYASGGSFAYGFLDTATGTNSFTVGSANKPKGAFSFALGYQNTIGEFGTFSGAFGQTNTITADQSYAFGSNNILSNTLSFAFGNSDTVASQSVSFGTSNKLQGQNGVAFGMNNKILSSASYSTVFGLNNISNNSYKLITGTYNDTTNYGNLFEIGYGTSSLRKNVFSIDTTGLATGFTPLTADSSNNLVTSAWVKRQMYGGGGTGGSTLSFGSGLVSGTYNGTAPQTIKVDTSLIATQYDLTLKLGVTQASTIYYPLTGNPSNFLTTITGSMVTGALGYIPYHPTDTLGTLATQYYVSTHIGGSVNSNVGAGYRLAVANTNNIKTLFAGNGLGFDSTSNTNGLTLKADTSKGTTALATYNQLTTNFDTVRVIPYPTAGIVMLRGSNDSLRSKNLIAGTNVTITQNSDSSVTIASTGGGGGITVNTATIDTVLRLGSTSTRNMSVGQITSTNTPFSAFNSKIKIVTQDTTTGILSHSPGFVLDSTGLNKKQYSVPSWDTTSMSFKIRSAQIIDTTGISSGKIVYWNGSTFAMESAGSTNANTGSGFRFAIPGTNNIKTLFCSGCTLDSTTNTNALTLTVTAGGSGTVTSVAQTVPTSLLSITGSPVTTTGTLAIGLTNAAAHSYWGNNTGSAAAPSYLTNTQLTADLNTFTSSTKGLAPSPGGATTTFLRADGTWVAVTTGTVTSVATGLGLSGGPITATGTIIADTTYLMTKNTNQISSGNKTFSGLHFLTGILNDTASLAKTKVLVQDTTNGKVYNYGFQTVDTTGKADGFSVKWNATAGNFVLSSGVKFQHTIFAPTTGGTVTLVNNQENIVKPAGTLATLTIALPSSPVNNDVVYITFTQAVTAITYSGGTVVGAPTTASLGGQWHLTYDSGTTTWY